MVVMCAASPAGAAGVPGGGIVMFHLPGYSWGLPMREVTAMVAGVYVLLDVAFTTPERHRRPLGHGALPTAWASWTRKDSTPDTTPHNRSDTTRRRNEIRMRHCCHAADRVTKARVVSRLSFNNSPGKTEIERIEIASCHLFPIRVRNAPFRHHPRDVCPADGAG